MKPDGLSSYSSIGLPTLSRLIFDSRSPELDSSGSRNVGMNDNLYCHLQMTRVSSYLFLGANTMRQDREPNGAESAKGIRFNTVLYHTPLK